MVHFPVDLLSWPNAVASALMMPLSTWIVLSGLDDIVVDIAGAAARLRNRSRRRPTRRSLSAAHPSRIAIFVPCWKEDTVLAAMVEGNHYRIRYAKYDFFLGVYPNDAETVAVALHLCERYPNVHLALCPHDGPTSKADCLNWVWQRMLAFEIANDVRFDVVVTHDAEDVIHPDALLWINWYIPAYEMVQVPVLPLPTPVTQFVHGVYCDEFAEFQARDMPAREWMGAFIPSNGVGTGFRRDALDDLGIAEANRIFDPACLTEDYENGLRLCLRGARQIFVDTGRNDVATREFFPQDFRTAVKQRTRWVTGIALQTWDRHGWKGGLATRYWLWRDRKGLIGHPVSVLTNALCLYGAVNWVACTITGRAWEVLPADELSSNLLAIGSGLALYRIFYRAVCVGHRFGAAFAICVPLRIVLANVINSLATLCAIHRFAAARWHGEPLRWVKTPHEYPTPQALATGRRQRLGEILVMNGYITSSQLERALQETRPGTRIGERLIELGYLDEDALYEALSLQSGLPQLEIDPGTVAVRTGRSLPAHVTRRLRLIPVKAEGGELTLACPDLPTEEIEAAVRSFTTLRPRFWLVTPTNFEKLAEALLY